MPSGVKLEVKNTFVTVTSDARGDAAAGTVRQTYPQPTTAERVNGRECESFFSCCDTVCIMPARKRVVAVHAQIYACVTLYAFLIVF